jgi:predicted O-methyltransferase YrrM
LLPYGSADRGWQWKDQTAFNYPAQNARDWRVAEKTVQEVADIYKLGGMLTNSEVDFLYRLGKVNHCDGVIVEIGSFKGKSTIALARGAGATHKAKVYAIDPHRIQPEEGYLEDTEAAFLANIKRSGLEHQVVPMIMTSEAAAKQWSQPVRLLWIDGDHRYEPAKLDFTQWEPHVVEGGIIAMHDTIRKRGPKRVLWEHVFRSGRFHEIAIVDNITAMRKVQKVGFLAALRNYATLGLRGIYIAARKSGLPYAKPAGRWLLRKLTAQAWLPLALFIFSSNMAR